MKGNINMQNKRLTLNAEKRKTKSIHAWTRRQKNRLKIILGREKALEKEIQA